MKMNKQVRFSNKSLLTVVDNLSLPQGQASKLWYSQEETDLFKEWLCLRVRDVRSELKYHGDLLDEELVTINAAALLGLEKYLTPELTMEYKDRRVALQRAVLKEHRRQRRNCQKSHSDSARLAMISAHYSQWARERARAAALFLEKDVMEDMEEMSLQAAAPRLVNNEADAAAGEKHMEHPYNYQRLWSSARSSVRNIVNAAQHNHT